MLLNIKARIHKRTSDDMADLGKKCNDLKQIHGLQMCLIAERFGVSSMAVHRWIKKAKEYGKIEEADEEEE